MKGRPRPKARLMLDIDNPYAKLGVSPLASADEIKRVAADKRGKAMADRRSQGQQGSAETEAEIIAIQDIEKMIGTPAARAAYDREHPQNALLTVQPSPRDRAFRPARAASYVTAWLLEELGNDVMLGHPDACWMWLPTGLDPELSRLLSRFHISPSRTSFELSPGSSGETFTPDALGQIRRRTE